MKVKAAILILLALALALQATPSFAAGQPVIIYSNWGTPQQPITVRPGYTNVPFTVVIEDQYPILYAQLNLSSTPFTNSTGGYLVMGESTSGIFTFIMNVKSTAGAGVYTFPITIVQSNGGSYTMNVSARVYPPPSVSAAEIYWGTPSESAYPYPGYGIAPLTVLISNPDSSPIYHVKLTLHLPAGILSQDGGRAVSFYISEVPPGSYGPATSFVNVTQDISPGTYAVQYNVTYMDSGGAFFNYSGNLELTIYPQASVSVSLNSPALLDGQYSQLSVSVRNSGSSAINDISVTVQPEGVELMQGNDSVKGTLGPGSSAKFTYLIYAPQSLPPGIYPVIVYLQYEYGGAVSQESYITYASVSSVPQEIYISITPSTLHYMRNNTVTLTVKNEVDQELKNVQLQISPAQSIYISRGYGPFNLGSIGPYGEANLTLSVLPYLSQDAVYPLQITLQYQGTANYTQENEQVIPLFIGGMITVNFSGVQAPAAYNGSADTISGTLINSGTEEAYYGTLYINSSQLGISQSEYIGDLPTDSPTPFSFTFSVPSNASSGSYPLQLTYIYQDSLGNQYRAAYTVYLSVLSGRAQIQATAHTFKFLPALGITIVLIVVIVVAYAVIRRLRK